MVQSKSHFLLFLAIALLLPSLAMASGMPWDTGLNKIVESISGPVAGAISLLAIIAAGAGIIFAGQEMGSFIKTLLFIVIVAALIVGANSILGLVGGSAGGGAVIASIIPIPYGIVG